MSKNRELKKNSKQQEIHNLQLEMRQAYKDNVLNLQMRLCKR